MDSAGDMNFARLLTRAGYSSRKFQVRSYELRAPIIFMHIPKTSGLALAHGMRTAIRPRRELACFDRVLFGAFRAFDTFSPIEQKCVCMTPADLPADSDFVTGHIALSTLHQRYGSANYVTVLREPVSRILSHWLFWRGMPDDYLALLGAWGDYVRQARGSLKAFLSCKQIACQVDNLSVRMLLWPHRGIPEGDFIDSQYDHLLLPEALTALKQFSFVDVIENPDMQINLQNWLGRPVPYLITNETPPVPSLLQRPLDDELTLETLDLIESIGAPEWT